MNNFVSQSNKMKGVCKTEMCKKHTGLQHMQHLDALLGISSVLIPHFMRDMSAKKDLWRNHMDENVSCSLCSQSHSSAKKSVLFAHFLILQNEIHLFDFWFDIYAKYSI